MKIAVISSENIPSQWAHSINTTKHAQGFFNLNHKVEILTVQGAKEFLMRVKLGNIQDFYDINRSIPIHYFNANPFIFFKKIKILESIFFQILHRFPFLSKLSIPEKKIAHYCRKNKIQLVYCRSFKGAFYCVINKIPTILETHSSQIDIEYFQKIIKLSHVRFFKGIVTIHEDLKKIYAGGGVPLDKILVLEDAVHLEKFEKVKVEKKQLRESLKLPKEKHIIMYCGSLKHGKGIGKIIETANSFDDDVLFYIVGGSKEDIKYWKAIIKKSQIRNVFFTGFVKNKIVPYYLKSADVLLMLYDLNEKNKIMDIETTSPIKLFEYMASKRPIVCTKLPTIEKVVQHNQEALLSEWNNIDDVQKNINNLLKNKDLANELSMNAYEKVQTFTYKNRCKRILEKFCN